MIRGLLIALIALTTATGINGNTISIFSSVTDEGNGYSYHYELTAQGESSVYAFMLTGLEGVVSGFATAPPGWIVDEGALSILWISFDPTLDILPGQTLGGFSFRSVLSPGIVPFLVLFDSPNNDIVEGTVIGPAAGSVSTVPEPSSFGLLGGALFGMLGMLLYRSRGLPKLSFLYWLSQPWVHRIEE